MRRNRKRTRKLGFDYATPGAYFVTACVKNRINHREIFGSVKNKIMTLNNNGLIVKRCWDDLPNHYHNIVLDEFIIMPDHVHGIVFIKNPINFPPLAGAAD